MNSQPTLTGIIVGSLVLAMLLIGTCVMVENVIVDIERLNESRFACLNQCAEINKHADNTGGPYCVC